MEEELQRWNIGSKLGILKKHEFFLELHGKTPKELNELFDQTRSLRGTLRCSSASGQSSPAGGSWTPSFSLRESHTYRNVFFAFLREDQKTITESL